mgnify:CR=1 FL=1
MSFDTLNKKEFLEQYWQKKPLVIRGGFAHLKDILEPDELAGLSCENGVESRIVIEEGGAKPWEVKHGPFSEDVYKSLPKDKWTLLVQGVEQWLPEVYEILDSFKFVPNWRVDDVMVSYAPDGGSVGAHTDQYDVFLIQGWGKREWRVGRSPLDEEDLIPGLELKILNGFEDFDSHTLELGDVLYLPPQYAHHGIAIGDSMTYSVGFRAPHNKELLGHFCDHLLIHGEQEYHYKDPNLGIQESSGEIKQEALEKLYKMVMSTVQNKESFTRFIGEYMTIPKYDVKPEPYVGKPWDDFSDELILEKFLGLRTVYQLEAGTIQFFANGKSTSLTMTAMELVKVICDGGIEFSWSELKSYCKDSESREFLTLLIGQGLLLPRDEA